MNSTITVHLDSARFERALQDFQRKLDMLSTRPSEVVRPMPDVAIAMVTVATLAPSPRRVSRRAILGLMP